MANLPGNPGIKALRRILLAKEVTAGTEVVPATALWRGVGVFEDQRETIFPDEDIGVISGLDRSYVAKVLGALAMDATPATFEQLPYLLAAGVKNVTTGVADGGGSGKIYAYPLPTTTKNTIQPYSLQGGDDNETEFAAYGFVEKISLEAKAGEAWMMQADWKARQINVRNVTATTISFASTGNKINDSANGLGGFKVGDKIIVSGTVNNNGTFTITAVTAGQLTVTETVTTETAGASVTLAATFSAVVVPTIEEILFGGSRLYIDAVGGTIGTTQKSLTMLGAKLDIETGWIPIWIGDYVYFAFNKLTPPKATLQLTFEHDGTASAEKAAWRAQTPRLIRLVSEGNALVTAGAYSKKSLVIDMGGKYEKVDKLGEQNGNDILTLTMKIKPNSAAGTFCTVTVVNSLASLP